MRLENTWQEIRDHSAIQNHSRSFRFTALWWCVLSSVHFTHFLQGSGQRTGMAKAEAWFCAQWPIFCVVFEVYVWIIVQLEDPNMACYTISNRISHLLIFICWCLIESMMACKQDVQDLQLKYRPTTSNIQQYIVVHMVILNPCVHQTHLECLLLKSSFFCFIWP